MNDSLPSLAFAVKSSPGVYAVLLGSGVSRAAAIPTGWEIVLDLIRRLAVVLGKDVGDDPASWYRSEFHEEADYSKVIDRLAATPAARRDLIRGYIEATPEHRDRNERVPTRAHTAIAHLVAGGYIRVIITTNFDRLIEQALEAVGVQPTVIRSTDDVRGMAPLAHSKCTVIKLHGDYLDARIRNTPIELEAYDAEMDALLDQVLDEYGLIVSGWSADYDIALDDAICRTPNRRYIVFWTGLQEPAGRARELIRARDGQFIRIESADAFFSRVDEMVSALESVERHHPLTRQLVVGLLKRHIEDGQTIRKHDLITEITNSVVTKLPALAEQQIALDGAELERRLQRYDAVIEPLLGLVVTGVYWEDDSEAHPYARSLLRLVGTAEYFGGDDASRNSRLYPALSLFYAAGIMAVLSGKFGWLRRLTEQEYRRRDLAEPLRLWSILWAGKVVRQEVGRLLPRMEGRYTALSDWLHAVLMPYFREYVTDETDYDFGFAQFEYLMSLLYINRRQVATPWAPLGRYHWEQSHDRPDGAIGRLRAELKLLRENWPPFSAGLFAQSFAEFESRLALFDQYRSQVYWG
jgi:hypothetical protein